MVIVAEHLLEEAGTPTITPLHRSAVAAVIDSPWSGKGYLEDLQSSARELATFLGNTLGDALIDEFGSAQASRQSARV